MKRLSSGLLAFLLFGSFVGLFTFGPTPVYALASSCSATSIYGTGADGNVVFSTPSTISSNKNYENMTVNAGITVTINDGVVVKICSLLLNSGHIFGATPGTGGTGSAGSPGSTGGAGNSVSATCTVSTGASTAGASASSGNGASGAAMCGPGIADTVTSGAGGSPGTDGGQGNTGGAGKTFTFYVYLIDNSGDIISQGGTGGNGGPGGTGGNGGSGSHGSLTDWVWGGGGGGKGGNGGHGGTGGTGGTITVYYGAIYGRTDLGTITAPGGNPGNGGAGANGGTHTTGTQGGSLCGAGKLGGTATGGGGNGAGVGPGCATSGGGTDGAAGSAAGMGSTGSSGSISLVLVVLVVQPVKVTTPTGGSAFSVGVSGCATNSTSFTSGTATHYFLVLSSCSLTLTMPAPSGNKAYVFASSSTTTSIATCVTTPCTLFNPNDYLQLTNTYEMAPSGTWNHAYTEPVTGTRAGIPATGCSITLANGGGAATCSANFDYNTLVTLPPAFASAGGAGSYISTPPNTFTDTTGGNTRNVAYAFTAQATPLTNTFALVQSVITNVASGACTATLSNPNVGDLMVLAVGGAGTIGLPSDTLVSPWAKMVSESEAAAGPWAYIYGAYVSGSVASEAISTVGSAQTVCTAYEIEGIQAYHHFTGVGQASTGTSYATGSTAFSGTPYIAIGVVGVSASMTWTVGASYTKQQATGYGNSEYSTTVTTPTTFPWTVGSNTNWADAGVVIAYGVPGANLYLQDATTGLPFSLGSYINSKVAVNFVGYKNPTFYGANGSQIVVNVYTASLLTVYVGTSYHDSIIPSSSNNTLWLAAPSLVYAYTLQVQDYSNSFAPGTALYVTSGAQTFSSGYTDVSNYYPFYGIPGAYTLTLVSGSNTFVTSVNLPAGSGPIPIPIEAQTVKSPASGSTSMFVWAGWNDVTGSVQAQFNDSTLLTTSLTVGLYIFNGSCWAPTYCAVASTTVAGTYGFISLSLPGKLADAQRYIVKFQATNAIVCSSYGGVCTFGPVYVAAITPPSSPLQAGFDLSPLFGAAMAASFPNWVNGASFLSYFILLATAMSFGKRYSSLALIAIAVEGSFLSALGLFGVGVTLAPEILGTLGFMGVLSYLTMREKRGSL